MICIMLFARVMGYDGNEGGKNKQRSLIVFNR